MSQPTLTCLTDNTRAARRLKILFVTSWYPSKAEPGKALWVREHAKALRAYDDVVVLHSAGFQPKLAKSWTVEREADERFEQGVITYRLYHRKPLVSKAWYPVYVYRVIRAIRQLSRRGFRPDVIHVHVYDAGVPAIIFGRLSGIPVVISEHFSSFPRHALGWLDLCKARFAMSRAQVVLPVSRYLQAALEKYHIRAHYELMPNVVDTDLFHPPPQRPQPHGLKRMLFVGQLVPVKDLARLLAVLGRLRTRRDDWRLDIVGEGPGRSEYEQLATDLDLTGAVFFHGQRSREEVAEFMRGADLFVLPSLVETFSLPVAEALASGTPVLATRCGGPEEFISSEAGLMVPAGDTDALYNGLDYILDNLHLYSGGHISQYAMERFAPNIVGAKLHAVYRSLTGGEA